MEPKKIERINELAKKKKTVGLTPEEKVEQAKLREEYIEGYRRSLRHHIEGSKRKRSTWQKFRRPKFLMKTTKNR